MGKTVFARIREHIRLRSAWTRTARLGGVGEDITHISLFVKIKWRVCFVRHEMNAQNVGAPSFLLQGWLDLIELALDCTGGPELVVGFSSPAPQY